MMRTDHEHDTGVAVAAEQPRLSADHALIAVVDPRLLIGECLVAALQAVDENLKFGVFRSVADLPELDQANLSILVVCVASKGQLDTICAEATSVLKRSRTRIPLVIVADEEDGSTVLRCLEAGASGYISTNLAVSVVAQALRLVQVGCTFIPADVLTRMVDGTPAQEPPGSDFNATQLRITEKVRKGIPNKIIAHELHMTENAVKMQVRLIMKRIKARNRTELAYRSGHLFGETTVSR